MYLQSKGLNIIGYIKCIVRSAVVHCINGREVNAFTRNNLEDTVNKCQIHLAICQLLKIQSIFNSFAVVALIITFNDTLLKSHQLVSEFTCF